MGKTCTLPTGQSQYQVVGRFVPNEKYGEGHAQCKVYRMKYCTLRRLQPEAQSHGDEEERL